MRTEILWAASSDLPAGWPLAGHTHSYYHLFYIVSGTGTFLLDGKAVPASSGSCLIIPPGVYHEMEADSHSLLDTREIKFILRSPEIEQVLRENGPVIRSASGFIDKATQYIVFNWSRQDPLVRDYMDSFLCSLLLSPHLEKSIAGNCSSYIDVAPYPELVRRIISCVEASHTEPFRLDSLAEELGYNKRYLCTLFRKETSLTIVEYLSHIRIRHAVLELYYHDVPVSVVAQRVGFITPLHFTRVFKAAIGIPPSVFKGRYSPSSGGDPLLRGVDDPLAACEKLFVKVLPLPDSVRFLRQLGDGGNRP